MVERYFHSPIRRHGRVLNQLSAEITSPLPLTLHNFCPHNCNVHMSSHEPPRSHHQKEGLQLKYTKPFTQCGGSSIGGVASFIGDRLCDFSHGGWQAGNTKSGADMVAPCVEGLRIGLRIRRPGYDSTTGQRGLLFATTWGPVLDSPKSPMHDYQELSTGIKRPEWEAHHHLPFSASHVFPQIGYITLFAHGSQTKAHNFMELEWISVHSWFRNKNISYMQNGTALLFFNYFPCFISKQLKN
jgi:hypothetical protein